MDNSFDSLLNASAVPQDEKVQAFIAESKNNRNRCYELSEQVTAQVATDGKMLQKYLDVQSTFDRYTTNNALLILAQRPWILERSWILFKTYGTPESSSDFRAGKNI